MLTRSLRSRLLIYSIPAGLALSAIALVVALVLAAMRMVGGGDAAPQEPATGSATAPPPSALTEVATGCLSPAGTEAEKLLSTQAQAQATPAGAAEFSGAWVRWVTSTPITDKDAVLAQTVVNPEAMALRLETQQASGQVTATLENSAYSSIMPSQADAWLRLAVNWTAEGSSGTNTILVSMHVVQREGRWLVDIAEPPTEDPSQFTTGMSTFSAGC